MSIKKGNSTIAGSANPFSTKDIVEYTDKNFVTDAQKILIDASASAGATPAGAINYFAGSTAPTGYLKSNGTIIAISAYPDLATAIYCGDSLNATALFGHKCTDATGATRSITGGYIALPDLRGEFIRGWDDGRGIDTGRTIASAQADAFKAHTHSLTAQYGNPGAGGNLANAGYTGLFTPNTWISSTGGTETRPRNISLLACIKY